MKQGLFITLEGVDGAGKSSHIDAIVQFFKDQNRTVHFTREPGGPALSETLREILLSQDMSIETETLLMFAARQESIKQVIEPALAQGHVVISDRFTDSTVAYQGGGRGFSLAKIDQLAQWVQGDLTPHLTLLFDVPLDVARTRLNVARLPDRFEKEGDVFFEAVRQAYLTLANAHPQRIKVIDSTQTLASVAQQVLQVLQNFYKECA